MGGHLFAEDLALDLVIMPDQLMTVVDQAEFEDLSIPAAERMKALEALDELMELARNALGPFKVKWGGGGLPPNIAVHDFFRAFHFSSGHIIKRI